MTTETKPKARRGTSNGNVSGNSEDRRRRKAWLIETYRADTMVRLRLGVWVPCEDDFPGAAPACRCYRCGDLLVFETVTVDRIIPGCRGGRYTRDNIRPSCQPCATQTGARLGVEQKRAKR